MRCAEVGSDDEASDARRFVRLLNPGRILDSTCTLYTSDAAAALVCVDTHGGMTTTTNNSHKLADCST